ncbi:hypothetical protein THRCLA_08075 [Thraustotheca clavata]|uniref:Uncharacterized protein n=1 Tax=Thraustotheca clavata TaxID=74557 RepID=A0A1V9ZA75_9STRA|nr:hypothetical protein THRCLA_08075 [Thraustotheca clavata]
MNINEQLALEVAKNARLEEEVDRLRKTIVNVTLLAEKEEEYILNQYLRRPKEASKKQTMILEEQMKKLRHEKVALGMQYEQEQESIVNRLCRQLQVKEATIFALARDDSGRYQRIEDRSRDAVTQLQKILAAVLLEKRISLKKKLAGVLNDKHTDADYAELRQLLTQSQHETQSMLTQLSQMEPKPQSGFKRIRRSPQFGPMQNIAPTSAC